LLAYFVPTCASIYWLYTDNKIPFLLSVSCLLLDFKFLLFFRAFEAFGVYFVIIISVANAIIPFIFVLFIILVSFAHAFLVLLIPKEIYSLDEPPLTNNDPNNPWHLTPSYNQLLEDGTLTSRPLFVQKPDTKTNMFTDYRTSLLSLYLFVTGTIHSFI